jgi:hypothetical protein
MTRMRLILSHTERTFERRARVGLQVAFELTGAETGFVIMRDAQGGMVVAGDERPLDPQLVKWAEAQIAESAPAPLPEKTIDETAQYSAGELRYCVIPLGSGRSALVLGFRAMSPRSPSDEVLATLARHIAEVTATEKLSPAPIDKTEAETKVD